MKIRAFFIVTFLALFTGHSYAQIVNILNENFDAGFPAGWSAVDADGNSPHAAVNFAGPSFTTHIDFDSTSTGDSILLATSWFDPAGVADNYLITPQLTLEANGNQLFWQAMSKDPSYPEAYEILVSTTLPVIDSFHVEDSLFYNSMEYPDWTDYVIDLDQYAGQQVYLAFRHISNDKFLLCLDNIRVVADLQLGIQSAENEKTIRSWPNPASEIICIRLPEEEISSISINDISGKVYSAPVISSQEHLLQLVVSEFPSGIYFITVETEGKLYHSRFVKS